MEVKINREIQEYQENIFFGLNLRQLVFSFLAIAAAVAVYFGLQNVLGTETVSWLCVISALPFAAMGFIKYNGMTAEQFAYAFLKSEVLTPKRLLFSDENYYYEAVEDVIEKQHAPAVRRAGKKTGKSKKKGKKRKKKGGTSHAQKSKQNLQKR